MGFQDSKGAGWSVNRSSHCRMQHRPNGKGGVKEYICRNDDNVTSQPSIMIGFVAPARLSGR